MLRLGYDIGGMSVRACLLDDERMEIVAQRSNVFPLGQGEDALMRLMEDLAREVGGPLGLSAEDHRSVGVGIPGTVHHDRGVLLSACNLHLDGMPIAQRMRTLFPRASVAVANDADAAAMAEYCAGAFRGYDSALLITVGTGIGGGMILNGQLFQGGLGIGCEIGHLTLAHNGAMCACGNRGCAETLCSASWLERQGRHCVLDYPMSRIAHFAERRPERVQAKHVLDAAKEGDGIAVQIFEEYIENLASLISTCCYLLGPRIVGLGGGVSEAGDFLIRPLETRVKRRTRRYVPEKIVAAQLGAAAGMIGAAMLPHTIENKGYYSKVE